MFKILLILVLFYLVFRAGRNLLRAAVQDGIMSGRHDAPSHTSSAQREAGRSAESPKRSADTRQIEDAVWEDLP